MARYSTSKISEYLLHTTKCCHRGYATRRRKLFVLGCPYTSRNERHIAHIYNNTSLTFYYRRFNFYFHLLKLPGPDNDEKPGLPVLVWIPAGANVYGRSKSYGPAYFLKEDIILVPINVRFGVFGFLSTGDEVDIFIRLRTQKKILVLGSL